MTDVGFVDIKRETYYWPLGAWTTDKHLNKLGRWFTPMFLDWIEALSMAYLTRSEMMTDQDVQLLLAEVRLELKHHELELCAFLPV